MYTVWLLLICIAMGKDMARTFFSLLWNGGGLNIFAIGYPVWI